MNFYGDFGLIFLAQDFKFSNYWTLFSDRNKIIEGFEYRLPEETPCNWFHNCPKTIS